MRLGLACTGSLSLDFFVRDERADQKLDPPDGGRYQFSVPHLCAPTPPYFFQPKFCRRYPPLKKFSKKISKHAILKSKGDLKIMFYALLSFLVLLFILAIIIYVVKLILDMIPLPAPAKTIAYLILGLIALFWLIGAVETVNVAKCVTLFCK